MKASASPAERPAARFGVLREQASLTDSESSTAITVRRMCSHVRHAIRTPIVRSAALAILKACPSRDQATVGCAIWAWVKHRVRFVHDDDLIWKLFNEVDQLELLIAPDVLLSLSLAEGDCDDFTMLICALAGALGLTCQIVCICSDPREPSRFSHVYPQLAVTDDGAPRWLALDAANGDAPGWRVPDEHTFRRQVWNLDGSVASDVVTMRRPREISAMPYVRQSNVDSGAPAAALVNYLRGGRPRRRRGVGAVTYSADPYDPTLGGTAVDTLDQPISSQDLAQLAGNWGPDATSMPIYISAAPATTTPAASSGWTQTLQNLLLGGERIASAAFTPPAYQQITTTPGGGSSTTTIRTAGQVPASTGITAAAAGSLLGSGLSGLSSVWVFGLVGIAMIFVMSSRGKG